MWFTPKWIKLLAETKKSGIVQRERVSKEFSTFMPSKKLYLYLLWHRVKAFRYKEVKTESKIKLFNRVNWQKTWMHGMSIIDNNKRHITFHVYFFFFSPILRPFWHNLSPVWDIGKWDIWFTYCHHLYIQLRALWFVQVYLSKLPLVKTISDLHIAKAIGQFSVFISLDLAADSPQLKICSHIFETLPLFGFQNITCLSLCYFFTCHCPFSFSLLCLPLLSDSLTLNGLFTSLGIPTP